MEVSLITVRSWSRSEAVERFLHQAQAFRDLIVPNVFLTSKNPQTVILSKAKDLGTR